VTAAKRETTGEKVVRRPPIEKSRQAKAQGIPSLEWQGPVVVFNEFLRRSTIENQIVWLTGDNAQTWQKIHFSKLILSASSVAIYKRGKK
jgi:hypothetical protein